MAQIPNKWKKHLTLVEFGLKTQKDLEREVIRYKKENSYELIKYLEKEFCNVSTQSAYILSLIPQTNYFKLPNYIVKNQEDITGFKEFLKKNNGFFSEVWCCEKPKRQGLDNVIGRISFNTGKKFRIEPEQIIEQVWSVNHREIEKYTKNSNINYLRASREGWNRRYEIEHVNITHKENKTKMINDFILAVQSIEGNRDKIENLLDFIKKIGISEIVLEYMLIGENFKFIDWDTSNDKKVIDTIFQKDNEEIERE